MVWVSSEGVDNIAINLEEKNGNPWWTIFKYYLWRCTRSKWETRRFFYDSIVLIKVQLFLLRRTRQRFFVTNVTVVFLTGSCVYIVDSSSCRFYWNDLRSINFKNFIMTKKITHRAKSVSQFVMDQRLKVVLLVDWIYSESRTNIGLWTIWVFNI